AFRSFLPACFFLFEEDCLSLKRGGKPAGYDNQVFHSIVFDCDGMFCSESDVSMPTSPVHDRYKSGEGYHAVPPPYTGTFMPPKPDLVFHDAPTFNETVPTAFNVDPSPTKHDMDSIGFLTQKINLRDKEVIDSGWSRHMTGNISYLSNFKAFNGGYVAFGGNLKGGKIIDTEFIVLSYDFKSLDENHVLLRVLRENNMYNVDLKNIVPSGDLTCLFAKATLDESNLWHRRLGHINFKAMNKLVKDKAGEGNVQQYVLFPRQSSGSKDPHNTNDDTTFEVKEPKSEVHVSPSSSAKTKKHDDKTNKEAKGKSPVELSIGVRNLSEEFEDFFDNMVNAASTPFPAVGQNSTNNTNTFSAAGPSNTVVSPTFRKSSYVDPSQYPHDPTMPALEDITYSDDEEDVSAEADFSNLETRIHVSPISTTKVHKDHPVTQIIGDLSSVTQTRSITRMVKDQGGLTQINNEDFHTCMFVCFFSQEEPKRVHQALKDPSWIEAMQEKLFQFKMQKVWVLVDLPKGKRAIGSKRVFRNKKDDSVARIETIRLFLAYASFMGFMVYQMDVKSAFLYGTTEEEVYVCQPLGFEDPDYPNKVYKVVKALYELHQAPRARYATLANYLLENGFHRGKISQALFIKKQKCDILLVQVYVNDIIFGSTNKDLGKDFKKLMKDKFQMSSIGELTFFLGLPVKQKQNRIFISQDKYVAEILRKFGLTDGKSASTPIDTEKTLLKDPDGEDVDVHTYRSMIGSLMYLTSLRPDSMFVVCACAYFQVTPKALHLHAVKRTFRYLMGKPHLGLWYPKDLPFNLVAYFDSDYAGASLDRKSTTGGCQFLGCRLISWQYKKQTVIATSSTEAEYVADASCCAQVLWIQHQLLDYGNEALAIPGKTATDASEGFEQIFVFLNASVIQYALTVSPTIYVSCIKQFWSSVSIKKTNDVVCLQALIDMRKVIITEDTVRQALQFDDAKSIDCLPNAEIFAELERMGLVRNVDSSSKFYMYLRFLQLTIDAQVSNLSSHTTKYTSYALTQKVFANMRRVGKGFSGVDTPLFEGFTSTPPPSPHQSPISQPSSPPPQQPPSHDVAISMDLLNTLLETCTTLTRKVEALEQDKIAQALEITKLKERVKRLEKNRKLKVSGLKRLKKVRSAQRVESSADIVMDDLEDASKQEG
nr:putative ribonuclease H-like domain-containing protein [Tanacetum cinerariifolium]